MHTNIFDRVCMRALCAGVYVRMIIDPQSPRSSHARPSPPPPTPTRPLYDDQQTGYDGLWVLEVHYSNPEEKAGLRDSTGLEVRFIRRAW
jgi:hypothetical protein